MPNDLDELIRASARDVGPTPDATSRARARVTAAARRRGLLSRIFASRRGRAGMIALALLLVGGGTTAAVTALRGGGGFPYAPAPQNCFALDGYTFTPPNLRDEVHLDDDGDATAAWVSGDGIVTVADRPASGSWGSPERLSDPATAPPGEVQLAGNGRGDLAAAWIRDDRLEVAVRPAGGDWESARVVSGADRRIVAMPGATSSLAVGPDGDVAVGWTGVDREGFDRRPDGGVAITGRPRTEVATRDVKGGWTRGRELRLGSGSLIGGAPALMVDTSGIITVAVPLMPPGVVVADLDPATLAPRPGTVRELTIAPATRALGRGGSYSGPTIVGADDGEAVVAWSTNGIVTVVSRDGDRSWGRPVRIGRPDAEANEPQVAVGGGRAAATWVSVSKDPRPGRPGYRARVVLVSTRGADGAWARPVALSPRSQVVSAPAIALDGRGDATVAWARGTNGISGTASSVRAATRAASAATWTTPAALSTPGLGPLFPMVAANAGGETLAVWSRCEGPASARVEAVTRASPSQAWSAPEALVGP